MVLDGIKFKENKMLEKTQRFTVNNLNISTKTLSISRFDVISEDGLEISVSQPHTQGFAPGDIEVVKDYIGITESPEITYLESVWTPEVIQSWLDAQQTEDTQ
jgi:hypothetical protein